MEEFEEKVERIAAAYIAIPCPEDESQWCHPEMHIWANLDEGDKDNHREFVAFVLKESAK